MCARRSAHAQTPIFVLIARTDARSVLGFDEAIDRAANAVGPGGGHGVTFNEGASRRPKKRGPFHLVPVIAKATLERLS